MINREKFINLWHKANAELIRLQRMEYEITALRSDLIENASALRGKNMDNYSARARAFEDVIKELDRILRDG